jgi:hypothetical protein
MLNEYYDRPDAHYTPTDMQHRGVVWREEPNMATSTNLLGTVK